MECGERAHLYEVWAPHYIPPMVFSRRRHRRRREPAHFTYSRWDGSQTGFDLDADHLFGEMADELLYHGDVNSALRQMMQNGLTDRDGRDMEGIRDMMQRLRERRREILENHNLGGVYDDIADSLREVVETERAALDQLGQPSEAEARVLATLLPVGGVCSVGGACADEEEEEVVEVECVQVVDV